MLLETDRLLLRHWETGDLPVFLDLYSRAEVMRWLGPPPRRPLAGLAEAERMLARWQARERGLPEPMGLWAVLAHGTHGPVGTVLLLPLDDADGPSGEVEVGWHLHPDHQGQGYASEAARALLERAGLPSVLALTLPANGPSIAVTARLGMTDEGLTDRWFGVTTRQFRWAG